MVLRLRLARIKTPGGAKRHAPLYNIVLAHDRTARDGKPLEVLGTYDPIPKKVVGAPEGARKVKDIKVDVSRAKYWLGVGAQPSDPVWRLLAMIGLLEPKWLPTGQQSENALKAVRFPTHVQRDSSGGSGSKGSLGVLQAQIDNAMSGKAERTGVGNTSPQDPNEA